MNKSNINELSAQTEADRNSTAQNQQVSQPNANTNVVGSLLGQREIKFRAWLIEDEGFTDEGPKMTYDLAFEEYAPVNEQLQSVLNLMQYTGLKDKNGKEIYEGDITNENRVFIFNRNGFWYKQINGDGNFPIVFWPETKQVEFEVIGNIFENPELLETLR